MVGYETTSKLFFRIDLFKSSYNNNTLRHKSTKTLMSPRYSNVTSSIRGYDYMICITQSQIHLFKPTQRTSKSAPKILPENHDENVCQPLCIGSWVEPASWSPKHTSSGSRDIPLSPQISTARHTSSVLKSLKTQSDKITSKGKLNPLQESGGGETS